MTIKEIQAFLANTKVYVNGKSKGIQEKLFSFGYTWGSGDKFVQYTNDPFIFIHKDKCFTHNNDMNNFVDNEYTEILAEEILSLTLTKPTYRQFKDMEECWKEMLNHKPFGWTRNIKDGYYYQIMCVPNNIDTWYFDMFNNHIFLDGTPFGIKEE